MRDTPARDGAAPDVEAAFADAAFDGLKARGVPFAIVRADTDAVVWANAAAAAHWGAADAAALGRALFGAQGRAGWFDGLARGLVPGRPPRLARAGLSRGFGLRAHTAVVRSWTAVEGTLIGFAVPDAPARAEGWSVDAWDPAGEAEPAAAPDALVGDAEAPTELDAAEAGAALARRGQVAVLRDRLSRAFDGAAALRLLWRTDAEGVVTQVDAQSFARLGSPLRFDGRSLPEVVSEFDPPGAERLRDALASRATWSGVAVDLPVSDGAARVPLALSASPVFAPSRAFAGFRGFGTVELGRLEAAVPRGRTPVGEPPPEPEATTAVSDQAAAPKAAEFDPAEAPQAAAPDAAAAPEPTVPEPTVPEPPAANVVQLRAFHGAAPGRFGAPPAGPAGPAPDPEAAGEGGAPPDAPLSDELAFQALAEALRARIGSPAREPAAAGREEPREAPMIAPAPAPDPAPPATAGGAALLLDQMPLGLLATVGSAARFANPAAAARLGYADVAALLAAGDELRAEAGEAGAVALRDVRGRTVSVPARSAAVSWEGRAATLWILGEDAPHRADESEGRAGELLDRVDDAVALLDGDGRIRRLNRRGERWFGGVAAPGRGFVHLLAPESRAAALALLGEVRGQRDGLGAPPLAREVVAQVSPRRDAEADGGGVPMLLTLGRLGTTGFYATLRDVTALKAAEGDATALRRAASERSAEGRDAGRLSALLARVDHEIRTPLSAILGFAEVMMDERLGPLGNPRYRDYLRDIHGAGTQVVALVGDLLDLSRIEAGELPLDVTAVDVNRIVAETVAQMQPEAHRERVIMRTSLGGRIPSALADENAARQIVRNLLSNAVKFNEPGGQVIVSTAAGEGDTVLLRVRDTGVGMTEDEIAAALEPFGGATPIRPAKAADGNGLGLPLTRALVGANGASMAIRSRPREGTLVEVAFASAGHAAEAREPA